MIAPIEGLDAWADAAMRRIRPLAETGVDLWEKTWTTAAEHRTFSLKIYRQGPLVTMEVGARHDGAVGDMWTSNFWNYVNLGRAHSLQDILVLHDWLAWRADGKAASV